MSDIKEYYMRRAFSVGGPYNNNNNSKELVHREREPRPGVIGDADGVITGRFINITYTIQQLHSIYLYVCVYVYSIYI
jgi:hypothetical protein